MWNLRDVSKLIYSMARVEPQSLTGDLSYYSLWLHEGQRVFEDRMTNTSDIALFRSLQRQLIREVFSRKTEQFDKKSFFVYERLLGEEHDAGEFVYIEKVN